MVTNVEHTIRIINQYYSISVVLQVFAIILLLAAVVLWFLLDIPHAFSAFFGLRSARALRAIRDSSKEGRDKVGHPLHRVKAVISWNTPSGGLSGESTTILPQNKESNDIETTVVLPQRDFVVRKHLVQAGTEEEIA